MREGEREGDWRERGREERYREIEKGRERDGEKLLERRREDRRTVRHADRLTGRQNTQPDC